jgi:hypothetical protein
MSPVWTALLSAAVALTISGSAYVFSQGALQTTVAELTRRITSSEQGAINRSEFNDLERRITGIEQGSINRSELTDIERRISSIEQGMLNRSELLDIVRRVTSLETVGSPALLALRNETDVDSKRITSLEQNIPSALNEANKIVTAQDLKLSVIQTRQDDGLRRLLIVETGTLPPLSDRLQVITTNISVVVQRVDVLERDVTALHNWEHEMLAKSCRPITPQ